MNVCIAAAAAVVLIFIIIRADSEESLCEKIVIWKSGIKAKHLKVNTVKMKVMLSCNRTKKRKARCCAQSIRNRFISYIVM